MSPMAMAEPVWYCEGASASERVASYGLRGRETP